MVKSNAQTLNTSWRVLDCGSGEVALTIDVVVGTYSPTASFTYEVYSNPSFGGVVPQTLLASITNLNQTFTFSNVPNLVLRSGTFSTPYSIRVEVVDPAQSRPIVIEKDIQISREFENAIVVATAQTNYHNCNTVSGMIDIQLTANGGQGNLEYIWSNGATSQNLLNVPLGTYSVTISDDLGCAKIINNIEIDAPILSAEIITPSSLECDLGHGIKVNGALSSYTIECYKTDGTLLGAFSGTQTLQGLESETFYELRIYDGSMCLREIIPGTTTPSAFDIMVNNFSGGLCSGGGVAGSIDIDVNQTAPAPFVGNFPYSYELINITNPSVILASGTNVNASTFSINSLNGGQISAGNYNLKITDQTGCSFSKGFTVGTNLSTLSPSSIFIQRETCAGLNGVIAFEIPSSFNPSASWGYSATGPNGYTSTGYIAYSPSSSSITLQNLAAGNYSIIINNGQCNVTLNYTVPKGNLSLAAPEVRHFCYATGKGAIGIKPLIGGLNVTNTNNLIFEWEYNGIPLLVPQNTAFLDQLDPGVYTVTVTAGNGGIGCLATQSITVLDNSLRLEDINLSPYMCGVLEGGVTIRATVAGVPIPATYIWPSGAGVDIPINQLGHNRREGLSPGTYDVTVTAANCTVVHPVTIQNQTLTNSFTPVVMATDLCNTGSGMVQVFGINGSIPRYSWSGGTAASLPNQRFFSAGNHSVTLTSGNCPDATLNFNITNRDISQINITERSDVCNNEIGSLVASGLPFNPPISAWSWTNSSGTNLTTGTELSNLSAGGPYTVNLNYGSCSLSQNASVVNSNINPIANITQADCNSVGIINSINITTDLDNHPSIKLLYTWSVAGGAFPFSSNAQTVNNLVEGTYLIEVTAVNKFNNNIVYCTESITATILAQPIFSANIQNVICGVLGEIEVIPSNLSSNSLTYKWYNSGNLLAGLTTAQIDNLNAGVYEVIVTDGSGNQCSQTYTVSEQNLEVTSIVTQDCGGDSGSIELTCNFSGAIFYWEDSEQNTYTDQNLYDLYEGTYNVTISHPNNPNCRLYRSYTITSPFIVTPNIMAPTCNGNDGQVHLRITNNNSNIISYSITDGTNTYYGQTIQGLPSGTYSYEVLDDNNCIKTGTFTIPTYQPLSFTLTSVVGNNCAVEINILNGREDFYLTLFNSDPNAALSNYYATYNTRNDIIQNLPEGTYQATLVDGSGCIAYNQIIISPSTTINNFNIQMRWNKGQTPPTNTPNDYLLADDVKDVIFVQLQNTFEEEEDAMGAYKDFCKDNSEDKLKVEYSLEAYHYTLYYYNLRDELVRTVPPEGVSFIDGQDLADLQTYRSGTNPSGTYIPSIPNHKMVTEYNYNALGQMTKTLSPDKGESNFWYTSDGLIRFSQDAHQLSKDRYTYTIYDDLRRIIETGEMKYTGALTTVILDDYKQIPVGANKKEWVKTHYTTPHFIDDALGNLTAIIYHNQTGENQRFLRNRVSYTEAWSGLKYPNNNKKIVTCTYSYDPHGNVEWMRNFIPGLGESYIRMEYDLLTQKVLKVAYNEFTPEAIFHRYEYDNQIRLTKVYTSTDNVIWDRDASYDYYPHGPLQRKELGEDRIQGCDYTYTIHGWLKAVNHPLLNNYGNTTQNDPGQDGLIGSPNEGVMQDVWGFSLGYYDKDYTRSNTLANTIDYNLLPLNSNGQIKELYNGNIVAWSNGVSKQIGKVNNGTVLGKNERLTQRNFQYDELHRIKSSEIRIAKAAGVPPIIPVFENLDNRFKTTYDYDANGNITQLMRYAGNSTTPQLLDNLSYNYDPSGGNNQLQNIRDAQGVIAGYGDVGDQNYAYNDRGDLKRSLDLSSGRITRIKWLSTGKVKSVTIEDPTKPEDSKIEYLYDGMGNRVAKLYKEVETNPVTWQYTYYVRDASGTILSTYKRSYTSTSNITKPYKSIWKQDERFIYGADKLGRVKTNYKLGTQKDVTLTLENFEGWTIEDRMPTTSSNIEQNSRLVGEKDYNLIDHLGNLTILLSDQKRGSFINNNLTAKVLSYDQYYPFGWSQPGRQKVASDGSRFGFNGMEKDPEINNGTQNTTFRKLDSRIGRWLSIDPLASSFPNQSPYNFGFNNPIFHTDKSGAAPDHWVKKKSSTPGKSIVYWDDNAIDQASTKDGEIYLGEYYMHNDPDGSVYTFLPNGRRSHYRSEKALAGLEHGDALLAREDAYLKSFARGQEQFMADFSMRRSASGRIALDITMQTIMFISPFKGFSRLANAKNTGALLNAAGKPASIYLSNKAANLYLLNSGVSLAGNLVSNKLYTGSFDPGKALAGVEFFDAAVQSTGVGLLANVFLPSVIDFKLDGSFTSSFTGKTLGATIIDLGLNRWAHNVGNAKTITQIKNDKLILSQHHTNMIDARAYASQFDGTPMFKTAFDYYMRTAPSAKLIPEPLIDLGEYPAYLFLLNGNGIIGTTVKDGLGL